MQQRDNNFTFATADSEESATVLSAQIEQQQTSMVQMAPNAHQQMSQEPTQSKCRQLSSFSSLESFESSPSYFASRNSMKVQPLLRTSKDVDATATLAAQALQIPALSESALLLLKTMRETANLDQAPKGVMGPQAGSAGRFGTIPLPGPSTTTNSGPRMDHDEKVKVLRALYANRTRNKVSHSFEQDDKSEATGEKSKEEQQQRGEETGEKKKAQEEQEEKRMTNTLQGELRNIIRQSSLVKTVVTPPNTAATSNTVTDDGSKSEAVARKQVPIPAAGSIIQVPKEFQPPQAPINNKRKSSSLDAEQGHEDKRVKRVSNSSRREFAGRCA